MKEQLRDFVDYLRFNRNASAHTVSAYQSDIEQYLAFIGAQGKTPPSKLERI